jgi:hypothetical protein
MNNHRSLVDMPRFDVTSDEQLSKIKPATKSGSRGDCMNGLST